MTGFQRLATKSIAVVGSLGTAGVALIAPVAMPATASAVSLPVANQCGGLAGYQPPAQGTQKPSGFKLQARHTSLASAKNVPSLSLAYQIWNSFDCTHYQHTHYVVTPQYVYADCVGWTGNLIKQATPNAWASMVSGTGIVKGVPTPLKMQTFFNSLASGTKATGWKARTSVAKIRGGDVIAWAPPGTTSGGGGHSVLAVSKPLLVPGTTNRYYLVVMDSTATRHGPLDTRNSKLPTSQRNAPLGVAANSGNGKAPASAPSGVGVGTIELVSGQGIANTGVYWSIPKAGSSAQPSPVMFGVARPTS